MSFDADSFLSLTIDQPLETRVTPVPEGEYTASIKNVLARTGQSSKDGSEFLSMDVLWEIDDQTGAVKAATGRSPAVVKQSLFIERSSNGGIATGAGANLRLGRLREAVGQNSGGPWAPSMLKGSVARVQVSHRLDKNDASIVYDEVSRVAKL